MEEHANKLIISTEFKQLIEKVQSHIAQVMLDREEMLLLCAAQICRTYTRDEKNYQ